MSRQIRSRLTQNRRSLADSATDAFVQTYALQNNVRNLKILARKSHLIQNQMACYHKGLPNT